VTFRLGALILLWPDLEVREMDLSNMTVGVHGFRS
jgi:hypothetical protein